MGSLEIARVHLKLHGFTWFVELIFNFCMSMSRLFDSTMFYQCLLQTILLGILLFILYVDSLISYGGCELSEVHTGSCVSMNLPPLKSSANHTIMFQVAGNILASIPRPYPDVFRDVWDSNHVKMPCSQQSMYPVTKPGEKEKTLESRWKLIRQAFSKSIRDSYELEEAIMSYNTRYIKRWNFRGLHAYFSSFCQPEEKSEFFDNILPQLIVLALELPHVVTHALPLLKKQQEYSLSMTQQQAACLLANAFLCTFPLRNSTSPTSEYSKYPSINFNSLYSQDTAGTLLRVGLSCRVSNLG